MKTSSHDTVIELRARLWDGPASDFGVAQERIRYENDYACTQFPVVARDAAIMPYQYGIPDV